MVDDIAVDIKALNQQFGKRMILQDINFSVKQGEILGLLGPSGSGKTTLIKAIVGMGIPRSGSVLVLNQTMPSLKVVQEIGYMAQADALYEDLNAIDNLLFFGAIYGWTGSKAKRRASEILELVDLAEHSKQPIHSFSGGMKRRLSLAIALFHDPKLLILDEPTVGIDPVLRQQFWKEFDRLKSKGRTIIITTHVMDEAERCDRLGLLRDGRMIAYGTPDCISY
jgi:ABC-2 type transport system ATP-binding protein